MPDVVTFSITGAREIAEALEKRPPIAARQIIQMSLRGSVEPWRQEMISRVQRGWHIFGRTKVTGIKGIKRGTFAGRSREYAVIARNVLIRTQIEPGGFAGDAKVFPSKRAFWSKFLEFGTRHQRQFAFVVPAFESGKGAVLASFIANVRTRLQKDLSVN
jgi:hypothetical protein